MGERQNAAPAPKEAIESLERRRWHYHDDDDEDSDDVFHEDD